MVLGVGLSNTDSPEFDCLQKHRIFNSAGKLAVLNPPKKISSVWSVKNDFVKIKAWLSMSIVFTERSKVSNVPNVVINHLRKAVLSATLKKFTTIKRCRI